ncbi:procollagen-lysine,2-oxoglutarate 5-dioxygenase 1-like isoform X2 [Homarus americanus]|uniref:procollagen-lysine,2-oxoglutarate 5-dioxygenase 1-like isoform X2 n=1 Tax=Homarus americanus TaxID=6706 RepID=UPI001C48F4EB|nr:procollagen-lysine,2-oxoglutarate 5-dioxygenase 1-like isoform X2 [Homarus americanus]
MLHRALAMTCLAFLASTTTADATMDVSYEVKEDLLDLDIALGLDTGVGVRCVEGLPRGEDGLDYCRPLSPQDRLRMNKTATNLLVLTVKRPGSDGFKRFLRSTKVYGYKVKVLGEDQKEVVDEKTHLQLLRDTFDSLSQDEDRVVLYTESEDALFSGGPVRVIEEFEASDADVLISADGFCWPDRTMEPNFPKVDRGKRFLNSGGFVGRVGTIHKLLSQSSEEASLQLLLTLAYVKDATRNKYNLKLDHLSTLFQNLNGATGDVELRFAGKEAYLQNTLYNTVPVVIRGNGHTNLVLHTLGSYLARSWNPEDGCRSCWDDMLSLEDKKEEELPKVTLAVFVEKATPFMEEFLDKINSLLYPTSRIDLFVHNVEEYHEEMINGWIEVVGEEFASVKYIKREEKVKEWHARNTAVDYCIERGCAYLLMVDSEAHLDNPFIVKLLIEQNREVVAPMMIRPYKAWSNFWGAITNDGFYARSMDYMEIVQSQRRGLWNVPFISGCYLLRRSLLDDPDKRPSFIKNLLDPDMALCENLREKGVFMHVSNRVDFGHLVNADKFDTSHMNNELWQVIENRWDWEHRYLHPNYSHAVAENTTVEMPCPDVYWFPLFKERFAKEMIETFENFGVWSDGTNNSRYDGGPPQAEIKSVGLGAIWQEIMSKWVSPMAKKIFIGYDRYPPRALMNFMVRYKPDEQPLLKPHHDTSTYTINVALNKPGVDYEGGGCRFVRYDCSVTDSRVGWVLMHPGRLTHLHEGLRTTAGTRYIIVSFVDP